MSRQLVKSTSLMGLMTFCSRLLGYARDVLIAHRFGASGEIDAFLIAFKIPNFMRRLFAEGAFSQAFVPVLSSYRAQNSESETQQFVSHVAGNLSLILLGVTMLGLVLAPLLVHLFAPGFHEDSVRFQSAVGMLRITFPYLMLISLTALLSGILNSLDRFVIGAFTPVFLNISLVLCLWYLSAHLAQPVYALAWGVLLGGILQVLFPSLFLWRSGHWPKPRIDFSDPGVRRILKLMVPALLGVSVNQLNLIIDSSFASYLVKGSVSWLYYSERLMEFPLGIFGVAIATVALPRLSRLFTTKDEVTFSLTLNWALKCVALVGLPSSLGLALLSQPLLASLFQSGHFLKFDVQMSAQSLQAYSVGILGFMLVKVLASGFYARQDIKTPVRFGLYTMVLHLLLNVALVGAFKHAGLAMATSIGSLFNAALLIVHLYRAQVLRFDANWVEFLIKLFLACGAMAGVIFYLSPNVDVWLAWPRGERFIRLSLIMLASCIAYVASLGGLGLKPRDLLVPSNTT